MRTVVLLLCRTALASTLLPASGQQMATVVLHLTSARRESVGRAGPVVRPQAEPSSQRRGAQSEALRVDRRAKSEHVCLTHYWADEHESQANKQSASEPTVSVLTYENPKNYALERILRRTSRDGLGEWKVFCERFLLGKREKISN